MLWSRNCLIHLKNYSFCFKNKNCSIIVLINQTNRFNEFLQQQSVNLTSSVFKPFIKSFRDSLAITFSQRWSTHKSITHQECWKCGESIEPEMEQYFCVCGVVQPPVDNRSYFQIFALPSKFDIDVRELSRKYIKLQFLLHPDKYSQKSEMEKQFSMEHSSLVNEAYHTLLKPLTRGLYLLKKKSPTLDPEMVQLNPEFLNHVMELNEKLFNVELGEEFKNMECDIIKELDTLIGKISESFKNDNYEKVLRLLSEMKYFSNLHDKILKIKVNDQIKFKE